MFKFIICFILLLQGVASASGSSFSDKIAALEKRYGGRLGVSLIDAADGSVLSYRGGERFPMCSTFKAILAGAVLKRAEKEKGFLDKAITVDKSAFVPYSPVTEKYAGHTMTVRQLCEAIMRLSDNTAANLLLDAVGGVTVVTAFAQNIDGGVFRLDRIEPDVNTAIPADVRDTVTPDAMAKIFADLLFGSTLSESGRTQFKEWLLMTETSAKRIRAGVPSGWVTGGKTGTGAYGVTNDVGVIFREGKSPLIVAVYYTSEKKGAAPCDAVVAEVGRVIAEFKK